MSKLRTQRFRFPFMVADTEAGPDIRWRKFGLTLRFTTPQGERCCVEFSDVEHFELLSDTELDPKLFPDDGVVEVVDSPLVQRLVSSGSLTGAETPDLKHLVIGFNEIGSYLVILFRAMEVRSV